jgi:hypothetical protein
MVNDNIDADMLYSIFFEESSLTQQSPENDCPSSDVSFDTLKSLVFPASLNKTIAGNGLATVCCPDTLNKTHKLSLKVLLVKSNSCHEPLAFNEDKS